jgi:hypothetical protein
MKEKDVDNPSLKSCLSRPVIKCYFITRLIINPCWELPLHNVGNSLALDTDLCLVKKELESFI